MQKDIERLCREYTDLTEEEIQVIKMMALVLQPLANLEDVDMFIDCPCREGDAIVVAEANPEEAVSSYKGSVVGMLAKAENEPAVARTLHLGIATKHMRARTQEDNCTIQAVEPIRYGNRVIAALIREKSISEEEEGTEANREGRTGTENWDNLESRAGYGAVEIPIYHMLSDGEWLTESIDEGLILVGHNGRVIFRNLYAKRLFQKLGFVSDILGQKYKNICLTEWKEHAENVETLKEVSCGNYYLWVRRIPVKKQGEIASAVIIRDITWNREQEKNLILKSKAIQELSHRVKNSLQTVVSLLRLQSRRTENEDARRILEDSLNRIFSISAVYELLAGAKEDWISLRETLNMVRNNAVQSFTGPDFRPQIHLEGDDVMVLSDIATSVALAVNELVQNALKYAFVGQGEGTIVIEIKSGRVYSQITIKDNGKGISLEKERRQGLGLSIVKSLVEDKLHGKLRIRSTETGTSVRFEFINDTMDFVSIEKEKQHEGTDSKRRY